MTAGRSRATTDASEGQPSRASRHVLQPTLRRVVLMVCGMLALTGCQLDVVADVVIEADGTGTITVTAEANAELVERVPTIAEDLVLDDIIEAGWVVDGPNPTESGGLILTLTHDFEGDREATNLLQSLGPPFNDPVIGRGQTGDTANNTARVNLGLPNGFAAFADEELISAVGSVPFEEQFDQSGIDPATAMTATFRLTIPGEAVAGETNGEPIDGDRLQWIAPLDGSILEATARTEQAPSEGGAWARPVSNVALIALVAWVGFMTLFIAYVAIARFRRSRRYRRRALP